MKYYLLLLFMFIGLHMALAQYSLKVKLGLPTANISSVDSTKTSNLDLIILNPDSAKPNEMTGLGEPEWEKPLPDVSFDKGNTKAVPVQPKVFSNTLEGNTAIILAQNYPNPFNKETTINFVLEDKRYVQLKVYDIIGLEVNTLVDAVLPPDDYSLKWTGQNENGKLLPTGTYFFQLSDGYNTITRMAMFENSKL